MNRYLIPLAALALMTGACSSPQTSQKAQPVPAQRAGTFATLATLWHFNAPFAAE